MTYVFVLTLQYWSDRAADGPAHVSILTEKSPVFLLNAGDKSPINHIYLLPSFIYLWQTRVFRPGCHSLWSQFMRSRLSLCVNYKLTSASRLIDFCLSGCPKAWLLSCGVTLSGTQTQCSGSFGLSALGDCRTRGSLQLAGVLLVSWVQRGSGWDDSNWTFSLWSFLCSTAVQMEGREGYEGA